MYIERQLGGQSLLPQVPRILSHVKPHPLGKASRISVMAIKYMVQPADAAIPVADSVLVPSA